MYMQWSVLLQWAMRVLDNEELATQGEAALKASTGRLTKLAK